MKLICVQENLKNAFLVTERATGQNMTLPILSTFLLRAEKNQLKITATNLEVAIEAYVPAKIEEEGEVCVSAKIITGFVNNLENGKVEVSKKDNKLEIKQGASGATIVTADCKNFPIIPKIKTNKKITIKKDDIRSGVKSVLNSISISDLKPEIAGINFDFGKKVLKIASTDSFRLSEKKIVLERPAEEESSFILPAKTTQELSRLLAEGDDGVDLFVDENQVLFEFDNIKIISKLIDGKFPDYEQIIPKDFKTKTTTNKQDFLGALKKASVFCGKTNEVKIKVEKNIIEIAAQDSEKGENSNEISAKTEGPLTEAVFNYKYLVDGVNNINDELITLCLNEKTTPVLILGEAEKGYLYLIMPIRA